MARIKSETFLDHSEDSHNILQYVTEDKDNQFALSLTRRLCPGCQESFKQGLAKGWWVLIDVVSTDPEDGFDILKVFKLTPRGIAERDKTNFH